MRVTCSTLVVVLLSFVSLVTSVEGAEVDADDACMLQSKSISATFQGAHATKTDVPIPDEKGEQLSRDVPEVMVGVNMTSFVEKIFKQMELEVSPQVGAAPTKNKLVLILFEFFFIIGCCGIDRCYMGQVCLGVVKGLTLGGFFIWAIIDWFVVVINSVHKSKSINSLGYVANFTPEAVDPAFYMSCFMLGIFACSCCCTVLTSCAGCASALLAGKKLPPDMSRS